MPCSWLQIRTACRAVDSGTDLRAAHTERAEVDCLNVAGHPALPEENDRTVRRTPDKMMRHPASAQVTTALVDISLRTYRDLRHDIPRAMDKTPLTQSLGVGLLDRADQARHAQFTALRPFALDGTDRLSHQQQASMIRRYIIWRNSHAYDQRLRRIVDRANVA